MMSFTDAEEGRLINFVAKYPEIYDVTHGNYRNAAINENIWETIAQELHKTSEECKRKWKFIRDGYQRFKKRSKLAGGRVPKNSKFQRHQQLMFLDGVPHKTVTTHNPDSPREETEEDEEGFNSVLSVFLEEKMETEQVKTEPFDPEPEYEDYTEVRPEKRTKRTNSELRLVKLWKKRDESMQNFIKSLNKKSNDDVELFCRHIAEVLRSLPPVFKAEAKKDISVLVSNYEIKAAQNLDREMDSTSK